MPQLCQVCYSSTPLRTPSPRPEAARPPGCPGRAGVRKQRKTGGAEKRSRFAARTAPHREGGSSGCPGAAAGPRGWGLLPSPDVKTKWGCPLRLLKERGGGSGLGESCPGRSAEVSKRWEARAAPGRSGTGAERSRALPEAPGGERSGTARRCCAGAGTRPGTGCGSRTAEGLS